MEDPPIMNRLKSAALILLAVVVTTSMVLIPNYQVAAQGSAALSIAPRKDYTIEPGKTITDTLLVRNQDKERPLNLSLRVVDFTYNDDSGAPKLMLDEDAAPTQESLRSFISIPEAVTIEPGGSQSIEMTVAIPEGQGGGSYYSAIVYSSGSSEGGNVGLSASGVSLVFVEVPGEGSQVLTLKQLGAYKETSSQTGGQYARFHSDAPKRVAYTLKNEGNLTGRPYGTITIKSLFGQEVVINDINPSNSLALNNQERTFSACIKLKNQETDFNGSRAEATTCTDAGLWPGFYSVDMTAYYGRNGSPTKDLVGHSWFIYMPWWAIVILVLVLAFIGYHIWKIVRHIRSKSTKTKLKKRK